MPDTTCTEAILSNDYYDFILEPEFVRQYSEVSGSCLQQIDRFAGFLYVPRNAIPGRELQNIYYYTTPKLYGLMEGTISDQIRVIPQQQDQIMNLHGENVMIGFIGTGIDYTSPYFQTSDGRTRVLGIWDQTIQTGTPPADAGYGSVYTEEMINEALAADSPADIVPSIDSHGNGTYLASVAAASENTSGNFRGVAPYASIGVVKLKEAKPYLKDFYAVPQSALAYQENDIIWAIRYLLELANEKGLPLAICLALGTSMGGHANNSFLAQYIDTVSVGGRCIVCGTGNEAGGRKHYFGQFQPNAEYMDVEVRVENNPTGFWMELWGLSPDIFTVSVISPSGEILQRVPYQINSGTNYQFTFEQSIFSVSYQLAGQSARNSVVAMRLLNPSNGIWTFRIYGNNLIYGSFHIWLPIQEFLQGNTYFLASNPEVTLTEPSTSLRSITVSGYDSGNNSILLESGRGYPLTNTVKPYIAAPGVAVPGIDLRNNILRRTGTGGSAAITTGVCALILQWNALSGSEIPLGNAGITTLLIRGADRDINRTYPNKEWGYGTLNVPATFEGFRPV